MTIDSNIELSLVLPAYNEAPSLRGAVQECLGALSRLGLSHELIIVNDCSTDSTGTIANRLAEEFPAVHVVHNPINLNVGLSLLIGIQASKGKIITHNSVDLPFDPNQLASILPCLDAADFAVVVRKNRQAHSFWRKITSVVHNNIIKFLFMVNVPDMNFVQVYKRDVLSNVKVKAKSPAFVTPEIIIRALNSNYKMAEILADFRPRKIGKGNFGKPRDILWTLADLVSFWIENLFRSRS